MRHAVTVAILLSFAGGCKKPAAKVTVPTAPAPAAPTVTGVAEPVVGNTNYESGAGAAQNVRNAVQRVVTQSEMASLGVFIELEYSLNTAGKMPETKTIMATLNEDAPAIAKAVNEGKIILCWTGEHKGLWAYEVGADTKGGLVLVTGSARRAEADEVRKLLGR